MAAADAKSIGAGNKFFVLAIMVTEWTHLMGPFVYNMARDATWRRQYIDTWYKSECEQLEANRSQCEAILMYPDKTPASSSAVERSNVPKSWDA